MKRLFLGLAVVALAMTSQASYLYWQVSESLGNSFNGHEITGYKVWAVNGNNEYLLDSYEYKPSVPGYVNIGTTVAPGVAYNADLAANLTVTVDAYTTVDTYVSGYTYYIEIVGYDTSVYGDGVAGVIGISESMTYEQANSHVTRTLQSISSIPAAWNGGTYAAPEPTSGLLLLVGASLLALKRRKV